MNNRFVGITHPDSATETLSYDDNGQLVKSEKSTGEMTNYQWNDQGMLVKVILPNGEPVEYFYDGNQRLISRKSSDGVDNFVQSGWDIMTKMDDVGKRTYYTGMSAVSGAGSSSVSSSGSSSAFSASESASASDSAKYFHYNHRGDTVLVTDANGEILHNLNYEAYGKPTNNEGIPINTLSLKNATAPTSGNNNLPNLFVGASGIRYDTKTNLHYMRFRWFSGEQMRFISPDLLMDLNRYAYVSGNPINKIDPSGLQVNSAYSGKRDPGYIDHYTNAADYYSYITRYSTPYGANFDEWHTRRIPEKDTGIISSMVDYAFKWRPGGAVASIGFKLSISTFQLSGGIAIVWFMKDLCKGKQNIQLYYFYRLPYNKLKPIVNKEHLLKNFGANIEFGNGIGALSYAVQRSKEPGTNIIYDYEGIFDVTSINGNYYAKAPNMFEIGASINPGFSLGFENQKIMYRRATLPNIMEDVLMFINDTIEANAPPEVRKGDESTGCPIRDFQKVFAPYLDGW